MNVRKLKDIARVDRSNIYPLAISECQAFMVILAGGTDKMGYTPRVRHKIGYTFSRCGAQRWCTPVSRLLALQPYAPGP